MSGNGRICFLSTGLLLVMLRTPVEAQCVADESLLCLNRDRFSVTTQWETTSGDSGLGRAQRITEETGYFWFFADDNVEVVVKVLDGCIVNNKFWIFAAGLTNVEVEIVVRDTLTAGQWKAASPLGSAFAPIQDTGALPCDSTAEIVVVGGLAVTIPPGWRYESEQETVASRAVLRVHSPRGSVLDLLPKGGHDYGLDPGLALEIRDAHLGGFAAIRSDYSNQEGALILSQFVLPAARESLEHLRIDVRWAGVDEIERHLIEKIIEGIEIE